MIVGACVIELRIPHARSLKDKRSVVKSILGRIQARSNVSAAEVGRLDAHRSASIGLAAAGSDPDVVRQTLEGVVRMIEEYYPVEVVEYYLDVRAY